MEDVRIRMIDLAASYFASWRHAMAAMEVDDERDYRPGARAVRELMEDPLLEEERTAVERAARRFFEEKEIRVALN